ncbi:MAG: MFS transporter [Anaerolineales bacterium]|nr:MFS transporter [Anaerolineales bacterium]
MRLAPWQKILYALGSLGVALSYQAFGTYLQFLYIDILGLKAALVGVGWGVYGVWNAINDPLAGYWSDNTRTRWGRRRPWLAATFIPVGLFFYLLWVPPAPLLQGGETPLFVYFMAVVLIFDLLWTLAVMNWTALFPEMVPDAAERAAVSGWRQLFSVVGLLLGVALPPALVGADWAGRGGMALAFGALTALTLGLSLAGSRENPAVGQLRQPPLLEAIRATLASGAFRWFALANLAKEFIYSLLTASIPFWAKYVLRLQAPVSVAGLTLDVGLQNSLLLGTALIMSLPTLPLWAWLAQRRGGRRAWQLAQVTFALGMALVFLATDFYQALAAIAMVGLSFSGLLVLPDLLIADVIDEDQTVTGARREGLYFGINGFVIRFAFTLQGLTLGAVLAATGYVNATAADLFPAQPPAALLGLRFLVAGLPILISLFVVWALQRYPLHGARLDRVRAQVAGPAE